MVDRIYIVIAWFIIFWGAVSYVPSIKEWSDNHPVLVNVVFWVVFWLLGPAVIAFISV